MLRFSENFKIFGKFWDFWKILRFSKNFEIFKKIWDFRKNWDFRKILRFSENFEIFGKCWDFRKILRFSIKVWDFRKNLIKCLKGYKSLESLCNVKIKKSLSEWVSESVTRSPIELFWTAKNNFYFWIHAWKVRYQIVLYKGTHLALVLYYQSRGWGTWLIWHKLEKAHRS